MRLTWRLPSTPNDVMFTLAGSLNSALSTQSLGAMLDARGLANELRESAHASGGQYLKLLHPHVHASVERASPREHLLRGDAEQLEALQALAARVSATLTASAIAHRLELYDDDDQLVSSFGG